MSAMRTRCGSPTSRRSRWASCGPPPRRRAPGHSCAPSVSPRAPAWPTSAAAGAGTPLRAVGLAGRAGRADLQRAEAAVGEPSELERVAGAMADVPAAVAVERPVVPELSDEPFDNVRRLFGLTVGQLG